MSARSGMAALINQVRMMADAGTADGTLGTAVLWDDDHVQEILDRHRRDIYHQGFRATPTYVSGGSIQWKTYLTGRENLEATSGGTAIFIVQNSVGGTIASSDYTADYQRGIVTFTNDQLGTAMFLTGREYDLNGAAADIWRQKAATSAKRYDVNADGQNLSRSQMMKQALEMSEYYASRSWPVTVTMTRDDIAPAGTPYGVERDHHRWTHRGEY